MSIDLIQMWHERAMPKPTDRDFDVQLGCHFEEIIEMLDALSFRGFDKKEMVEDLECLANGLKRGSIKAYIDGRKEFLDAAADQIVTATGAAYRAGMKITEAVSRVNTSNWSKYDADGKPIFNEHGKIMKGPDYKAPDLEGLY